MTKKQMIRLIVLAFVLVAVLTFFVISWGLAQEHGNTIIVEWQNWFGIVKKAVVDDPTETAKFLFRK